VSAAPRASPASALACDKENDLAHNTITNAMVAITAAEAAGIGKE
jgi:hypothetical protein